MSPILFLDIDGVLNHWRHRQQFGMDSVDPECVNCLTTILLETQAKLVITSTWRTAHTTVDSFKNDFGKVLEQSGAQSPGLVLDAILDMTLDLPGNRGSEVEEWLQSHHHQGSFAILEDDEDLFSGARDLKPHLFLTNDDGLGLIWSISKVVIQYLKGFDGE